MLKTVICDWNRTLFEDEFETEFFRGLASYVTENSLKNFKLGKLFRLWNAKKRCESLHRQILKSKRIAPEQTIEEILDILNRTIIRGLSVVALDKYLIIYAEEARKRLAQELLRPLRNIREQYQVLLGILSSGCDVAIAQTLAAGGYQFDFVKANRFQQIGGQLESFQFEICANKVGVLKNIFAERKIDPDSTMYIGNDWPDKECLKLVRYPVVSFLACPETRISLKREVNAYVPNSERDFVQHLQEALSQ